MSKCPVCGTAMEPLFTSLYCPAEATHDKWQWWYAPMSAKYDQALGAPLHWDAFPTFEQAKQWSNQRPTLDGWSVWRVWGFEVDNTMGLGMVLVKVSNAERMDET